MMRETVATYRVQFRNGFQFAHAAEIVPYLKRLGVSHLYASPIWEAAPGSTHGYDVTDPTSFDASLGGKAGFDRLAAALRAAGLGLVLDIVPNHMAAVPENPWWRDVLEWGRASPHADTFDVDWSAPELVLPVLAAPYGDVIDSGDLGLTFDDRDCRLLLTHAGLKLPLAPPTYADVIRSAGAGLDGIAADFAAASPATVEEARARLLEALRGDSIADFRAAVERFATDTDQLHALHERQHWRLAYWRYGRDALNYRRFFEITGLIGVRVERPAVFRAVHKLPLQLVKQGAADGLRIDHVDGLADPKGYLGRLADAAQGKARVYVEKILEGDERLREDWPVAGTTGYEFITALAGLLVDPAGEEAFDDSYRSFLGDRDPGADAFGLKERILVENLASELDNLVRQATELAGKDPRTRDFGPDTLRQSIVALAAAFPVYRTYVDRDGASPDDRAVIEAASDEAKRLARLEDPGAIEAVADYLMLQVPARRKAETRAFVRRFQQTTGPVMAKAVEDTAFYRDLRLVGLNEVGGDPTHFGAPVAQFHKRMAERAAKHPRTLSATATHDTKRGEDARTRLYALSERPSEWTKVVHRLSSRAERFRAELEEGPAPERWDEWMIFQAILAAWPPALSAADADGLQQFRDRLEAYLRKAMREAKVRTNWTAPNEDYEEAVLGFGRRLLDPEEGIVQELPDLFHPFLLAGALNSIVQTLLKLTAPGVPDIYQGTELWDLSFVDPDNRQPVDFPAREANADSIMNEPLDVLLTAWKSARIKQRVMMTGLRARNSTPALFCEGTYRPLAATGERAGNVAAFARISAEGCAVVVAPIRAGAGVTGDTPVVAPEFWGDTSVAAIPELGGRPISDQFTGRIVQFSDRVPLSAILSDFPVMLGL